MAFVCRARSLSLIDAVHLAVATELRFANHANKRERERSRWGRKTEQQPSTTHTVPPHWTCAQMNMIFNCLQVATVYLANKSIKHKSGERMVYLI